MIRRGDEDWSRTDAEGAIPEDVREIASRVDRLGAAERASAPAGMDQRLIGAMRAAAGRPGLTLAGEGPVRVRIRARAWWQSNVVRAAAALLFVGAGVMVWSTMNGRSAGRGAVAIGTEPTSVAEAALKDDLELLYAIRTPDAAWDSLSTDLDLLSTDAETLNARGSSTDWTKSALEEGTL